MTGVNALVRGLRKDTRAGCELRLRRKPAAATKTPQKNAKDAPAKEWHAARR
ncbi:hypothetical protein GCM10009537_20650 [Corynebacterium riegelii]